MTQGWQPIDTAPRDGTIILARQGGYYPCYVLWHDGNWKAVSYQATQVPTHWLPPPNGPRVPPVDGEVAREGER